MSIRRALRAITLLLLVSPLVLMAGGLAAPPVALADPDIEMAADYPSIVVEPGKTVSLDLRLTNRERVGQKVDLSIPTAPAGWNVVVKDPLRGYGIRSIYVPSGESRTLSFEAVPPEDVKPGEYAFVIKGESNGVSQTLPLNIKVEEKQVSGTKVVSQYPVLRGPTGSKFEFRVDLTNGTGEEQSYALAASAPQGWEVSFQPAYERKQISSIRMKPGDTSGLNIEVTPPKQAPAGECPIDLQVSAGTERIAGRLRVVLTGTYDMNMATSSGRLNLSAIAGSEAPLSILIGNSGSADLSGISLASSKPSGW